MKYHYSIGLVGMSIVLLIINWYATKVVALSTGYFPLVYLLLSLTDLCLFGYFYIRTFAQHIFPELDRLVVIGAGAMYDSLLDKVNKHSQLPAASRKPFVYPKHVDNSHRGIIEYIPRFRHQRQQYLKHYRFIIDELANPDCHYGLVVEQIEELRALLVPEEYE